MNVSFFGSLFSDREDWCRLQRKRLKLSRTSRLQEYHGGRIDRIGSDCESKPGPFADFRVDCDLTPKTSADLLAYEESQPISILVQISANFPLRAPVELECFRNFIRVHSNPLVFHRDVDRYTVLCRDNRHFIDANRNCAISLELDRVR